MGINFMNVLVASFISAAWWVDSESFVLQQPGGLDRNALFPNQNLSLNR